MHVEPTNHSDNYAQRAIEYAQRAAADRSGKQHCIWVQLAAKRFLKELKRKRFEYTFDTWHANNVCDFIEKLPHAEGQWATPHIQLEDWQCFLLCNLFGWRRANGNRRFTFFYGELARKAAKSSLAAAVAIYCLCCEEELAPQIIIGATTGDQASKVFNPAKQMCKRTPDLRDWKDLEVFARSIVCNDNAGFIQTINAKASTQDGWNPHVGILDELHAHKDRGLFDVIRSAFGARKNPLMFIITTAGYNVQGICYEQRTMLTKVLQGKIKADHVFGLIYTLDANDDPYDESKWIKANPMIGITPSWESMRQYADEAKASPGVAFEFKTKKLNIWTTAKNAWLNMRLWDQCKSGFTRNLASVPCYLGVDLASTCDITALVAAWEVDGKLYYRSWLFLPEDTIAEHMHKRQLPYQTWVDTQQIIVTPGNATDYNFLQQKIEQLKDEFDIKIIGYDPWNAAQLANNLSEQGFQMVEVRQGATSLNQPMKDLETHVRNKTLIRDGNLVMDWMASNVVARYDANNNMAPDKKHSHEKIDGIAALLNALHVMRLEEEPEFTVAAALG